jgi:hypothetical protein
MPPAVAHLHLGSPKTGTTYLQDTLWANREALAEAGILLPGGSRTDVSNVVGDVLRWTPADGPLPAAWSRLCDEVRAWTGHAVVISHEHVHKSDRDQWAALVDSLGVERVQVVLTARDLARSVPAQWQSSVRQRHSWTLGEYADAVAAMDPEHQSGPFGPARHFWRRQNTASILRRFVRRLSLEQVRLVTVPPSGGDPDELWRRFCRACDIDVSLTRPGEVSHESLGAASAEVMRRLNVVPAVVELPDQEYKRTVNHALSRQALSLRRAEEPALVLPERHAEWAERGARRMVERIVATGVEVVGDLDDLVPRPPSRPYVDPEALPESDLLEAALAGITGLALAHVGLREALYEARQQRPAGGAPAAEEGDDGDDGDDTAGPLGLDRVLRRFGRS